MKEEKLISRAMAILGRKKSPAKTAAARRNAALSGGRPRVYKPCKSFETGIHQFRSGHCVCGLSKAQAKA
jgi:hypothetical protein